MARGEKMRKLQTRRWRWFLWLGGGLLAVLALVACAGLVAARRAEPWLRARIVAELTQRFQARVELDGFKVWFSDGLWAEGTGLRIWPPANVEGVIVPAPGGNPQSGSSSLAGPMISLAGFRFHAPLRYKPGVPMHISMVELKGLTVDLPPRTHFSHASAARPAAVSHLLLRFQVDAMECDGVHLTLETSKPGKLPFELDIQHLRLTSNGQSDVMAYEGGLTIPSPSGEIRTSGIFGPWQVQDPGLTSIAGQYRFIDADLSTLRGIAGKLNSAGQYQGTLRDLTVQGETNTPNFSLTHFGSELPLHTRFHATVDGTTGDTWLDPVEAMLGHSHFRASGEVVRVLENGQSIGHDINLKVNVDGGRIEDFLRLTSHSGTPLLTGALSMKTDFDLPPGKEPVHQRIKLNGAFALDQVMFTSVKIQDRIAELSARGQGDPAAAKSPEALQTHSAMHGNFAMAAGVIQLPDLAYTVPGAEVDLKGTYGVEGGALDFAGNAKLQATISQILGGWKGALAKPLDGLFRHGGAGTEVPIHIRGTREQPDIGVDFGHFSISAPHHAARQP